MKHKRQTVILSDVKNLKINDIIMRLKTTSAVSDKYAQTLDILHELIEEEESLEDKSHIKVPLTKIIQEPLNYKFIEKAVKSKNLKVQEAGQKILDIIRSSKS